MTNFSPDSFPVVFETHTARGAGGDGKKEKKSFSHSLSPFASNFGHHFGKVRDNWKRASYRSEKKNSMYCTIS